MLITLEELELRRVVVSETYASKALDYHGADFEQLGPLKIDATAELQGAEVRIRGKLQTRVRTSCDRCLARVEIPIQPEFDLYYRPLETIARAEEVEIPAQELDIGFFSGAGIELADVAREQVLLSLPMKILCRADCRGLCPRCGANRNLDECHCPPAGDGSPFAALKGE